MLTRTGSDDDTEPQNLEAALALWRGEPLQGCDYAWADGHIHRLQATLIGLLERAGHARLARGDAAARSSSPSKPSRSTNSTRHPGDSHSRPTMRSGLRESTTRRYDQLARDLDQQLGLQPTRETQLLYRQLLEQA